VRERRTFRLDSLRGIGDGVVQSIVQSVALLIAVQVFALPDGLLALIASAPFIGNLLSLFYPARFSTSRLTKAQLAAAPLFGAAVAWLCAAWLPTGLGFALVTTLAIVLFTLRLSFLTAVYSDNYQRERRGVLFSRGLILLTVSSLVASWGFGQLLDVNLDVYRWILSVGGLAALGAALSVWCMPSSPPDATGAANPFRNLTLVRTNKPFGYILLVWFIFGFANLWLNPLRVVYVAEEARGLGLSPMSVLLILGVAVESGRLISTPVWAWLFDRINFILLRMMVNAFMGIGILLFFWSQDPLIIGLGSFLTGVCTGGGGIAWNLWVTHFAPPRDTHIYMSVHTFLTGVRGVIGPYLGFIALESLSLRQISWISGVLILISILMLPFALPMMRRQASTQEGHG